MEEVLTLMLPVVVFTVVLIIVDGVFSFFVWLAGVIQEAVGI